MKDYIRRKESDSHQPSQTVDYSLLCDAGAVVLKFIVIITSQTEFHLHSLSISIHDLIGAI